MLLVAAGLFSPQSAIVGALRQWHSDLPLHPTEALVAEQSVRSLPRALLQPYTAFASASALWPVAAYNAVDKALVADFAIPSWGHHGSAPGPGLPAATAAAASAAATVADSGATPVTIIVGQLASGRHRIAASIVSLTSTDNSCVHLSFEELFLLFELLSLLLAFQQ